MQDHVEYVLFWAAGNCQSVFFFSRIEFAKAKEIELYNCLMDMALKKQDEIKRLIATTISDMREDLLQRASDYDFIGKIRL